MLLAAAVLALLAQPSAPVFAAVSRTTNTLTLFAESNNHLKPQPTTIKKPPLHWLQNTNNHILAQSHEGNITVLDELTYDPTTKKLTAKTLIKADGDVLFAP